MKKSYLLGYVPLVLFFSVLSCGRKDPEVMDVKTKPAAEQYFKQFEFNRPVSTSPTGGPGSYLHSAKPGSKDGMYYKANLFLLDNNDYVFEYSELRPNKAEQKDSGEGALEQAVVVGRWHIDGTELILDGLGKATAYTTDENKPAIKLKVTRNLKEINKALSQTAPAEEVIMIYGAKARMLPHDLKTLVDESKKPRDNKQKFRD